jgi:Mobilization protein NikA
MISGMRRLSGNRQNCSLYIRLFEDELQSIKDAAAAEGKTVSEYVRARVLDNRANVPAAHVPDPPAEIGAPIVEASEWSEIDRTAARKNSHPLGCTCMYCDRIREMFKEKKPAAPADKKTPPKKRKR